MAGADEGNHATLSVRVPPKASANRISVRDRGIRIAVTAPPVDGAANQAVCRVLAHELGLPISCVTIDRGHKSREKTVRIAGLTAAAALERLTANAPTQSSSS